MRIIREEGSTRLRASLRGVLPAVATLAILIGGSLLAGLAIGAIAEEGSAVEGLLALFATISLYAVMIGVAIWGAAGLDRRHYTDYGLNVDRRWARNFVAGAVISSVAILASLWWAERRGFRDVDVAAAGVSGPGGPVVLGGAFAVLIGMLLLGNVYEEIVYRGIMIGNFAEGLVDRGFGPVGAVVAATAASLLVFGAYHVPLRGNLVVAVDSALIGITFALAYLLTGELGLPIGVHFGRLPLELMHGQEFGAFEVLAIVEITRDTLPANLEVKVVRLGLVCLFLLAWIYVNTGEIRIAESVYRHDGDRSGED